MPARLHRTGMLVTDLDGTLLGGDRRIGTEDHAVLRACAEHGIVRVVATGRSLYSARRVLTESTPIDYLVFSSGAGIIDWQSQDLIRAQHLGPGQVAAVAEALAAADLSFMLHAPVPENHHFRFRRGSERVPDFERRLLMYRDFARPMTTLHECPERASQFVAVTANGLLGHLTELRNALPGLNVVRTTSPLDGHSLWIEVFPAAVSKAKAAAWVAAREGVPESGVVGVGNDFNDLDLLRWAHRSFVVGNAPEELLQQFDVTRPNTEAGVAEALRRTFPRLARAPGSDG